MSSNTRVCHIIGFPFSGGQHRVGVETGPQGIRDAGLVEEIESLGHVVQDHGDLAIDTSSNKDKSVRVLANARGAGKDGFVRNAEGVGAACKLLHDEVYAALNSASESGHAPFVAVLGGDHALAIGSISAVLRARKDTCVVWVDAHADINKPETSPSGNIHGMPVAYLAGEAMEDSMRSFLDESWRLDLKRIAYIGLRDLDAGEKVLLKQRNILAFTASDVERIGITEVMRRILEYFPAEAPLHLSFDVDGVDPQYTPATGTKVEGGITYREAKVICETLWTTGRLHSCDMTEVNPKNGTEQDGRKTAAAAADFLASAMGKSQI